MDANEVIVWILMICMLLGAIDRMIGNKLGLGEQFEEGLNAMGPLSISMVGIVCLAPDLAKILNPVINPVFQLFGADPGMFAGTLLAIDMGGWPLAQEMSATPEVAELSGLILGSMMGATIVFTIPVALGIIEKEDRGYLSKGILAGVVTVPVGVFVGGVVAGYGPVMILRNLVPIIIFAILIALGLWRFPDKMTRGFEVFGRILVVVITIGLAIGVFEFMTGVQVMPAGWELTPVTEGFSIVASIAMMLMGAFPAVHLIIKLLGKPLGRIGRLIGINESAAGGFIATLANNIPMFQIFKDMDARGKVVNAAFAVSAAFMFGDHLGFVAGAERTMIVPVIVGKAVGGITAVALVLLLFGKSLPSAGGNQDVEQEGTEPAPVDD
ncbi:ethanolamine utilization protein EutH [Propionibacterium australiense]|uniref:Ethanolamine utilisation protein EutH n=1 Tax=Propionibacterium australiense TaxID=119981 RepID=A0A383S7I2_9ACTN|nr:ethanolamine utilization protein EutH [Propionibacterium australiense]RLP10933.1 ethanolamine utilization protein EutH [Propionibacterium australiense]RLP13100.1 ethanolamine utilization protein EutH [Propionibacterium australiense]SYZ33887.1 Ethanolamine utilisation protein EutH [Propionibacterium australiense]VEH90884.1 ethanolamine utilization protein EutH [Propionibacterium australiense]